MVGNFALRGKRIFHTFFEIYALIYQGQQCNGLGCMSHVTFKQESLRIKRNV